MVIISDNAAFPAPSPLQVFHLMPVGGSFVVTNGKELPHGAWGMQWARGVRLASIELIVQLIEQLE